MTDAPLSLRLKAILADARWMTPKRARAYAITFAELNLVVVAVGLVLTRHGIAPNGKLPGTDFASFWAAARLALGGEAAAWGSGREMVVQRSLTGGRDLRFALFFYPPVFLLYLLPFGLLPYLSRRRPGCW